jgi:hypothetical protein
MTDGATEAENGGGGQRKGVAPKSHPPWDTFKNRRHQPDGIDATVQAAPWEPV